MSEIREELDGIFAGELSELATYPQALALAKTERERFEALFTVSRPAVDDKWAALAQVEGLMTVVNDGMANYPRSKALYDSDRDGFLRRFFAARAYLSGATAYSEWHALNLVETRLGRESLPGSEELIALFAQQSADLNAYPLAKKLAQNIPGRFEEHWGMAYEVSGDKWKTLALIESLERITEDRNGRMENYPLVTNYKFTTEFKRSFFAERHALLDEPDGDWKAVANIERSLKAKADEEKK